MNGEANMTDNATDKLLRAIKKRKQKQIEEELAKTRDYSDTSSDADEEEDSASEIAFLIVAVGFCVLLFAIGFVFLMQPDDSGGTHGQQSYGGRRQRHGRKAKAVSVDVSVSLPELFTGTTKKTTVSRQIVCSGNDKEKCQNSYCKGSRVQTHAVRDMWSGAIDRTYYCRKTVQITGIINAGTKGGDAVRIEEKGNISPNMRQGDVIFRIHELSHRSFRRDGMVLHTSLDITLREALLGWSRVMTHLDGTTFTVDSSQTMNGQQNGMSGTTSPDEVVVIKHRGFPSNKYGKKGDLHVKVAVSFPIMENVLTDKLAEQITDLF